MLPTSSSLNVRNTLVWVAPANNILDETVIKGRQIDVRVFYQDPDLAEQFLMDKFISVTTGVNTSTSHNNHDTASNNNNNQPRNQQQNVILNSDGDVNNNITSSASSHMITDTTQQTIFCVVTDSVKLIRGHFLEFHDVYDSYDINWIALKTEKNHKEITTLLNQDLSLEGKFYRVEDCRNYSNDNRYKHVIGHMMRCFMLEKKRVGGGAATATGIGNNNNTDSAPSSPEGASTDDNDKSKSSFENHQNNNNIADHYNNSLSDPHPPPSLFHHLTHITYKQSSPNGTIWFGVDPNTKQRMAVRHFPPGIKCSFEIYERLQKISITNPENVVAPIFVSTEERYFIMESYEFNIEGVFQHRPCPYSFILRILKALISAMRSVHEVGCVFRSAGPMGMGIDNEHKIRVAVSYCVTKENPTENLGILMKHFCSPEGLIDDEFTEAGDVFSMGLCIGKLITGQRFFDNVHSEELKDHMKKLRDEDKLESALETIVQNANSLSMNDNDDDDALNDSQEKKNKNPSLRWKKIQHFTKKTPQNSFLNYYLNKMFDKKNAEEQASGSDVDDDDDSCSSSTTSSCASSSTSSARATASSSLRPSTNVSQSTFTNNNNTNNDSPSANNDDIQNNNTTNPPSPQYVEASSPNTLKAKRQKREKQKTEVAYEKVDDVANLIMKKKSSKMLSRNKTSYGKLSNNNSSNDGLFPLEFIQLIERMLSFDPKKRPTLDEIEEIFYEKEESSTPSEEKNSNSNSTTDVGTSSSSSVERRVVHQQRIPRPLPKIEIRDACFAIKQVEKGSWRFRFVEEKIAKAQLQCLDSHLRFTVESVVAIVNPVLRAIHEETKDKLHSQLVEHEKRKFQRHQQHLQNQANHRQNSISSSPQGNNNNNSRHFDANNNNINNAAPVSPSSPSLSSPMTPQLTNSLFETASSLTNNNNQSSSIDALNLTTSSSAANNNNNNNSNSNPSHQHQPSSPFSAPATFDPPPVPEDTVAFYGVRKTSVGLRDSILRLGLLRSGHPLNPKDMRYHVERGTIGLNTEGVYLSKFPLKAAEFTQDEHLTDGDLVEILIFEVCMGHSTAWTRGSQFRSSLYQRYDSFMTADELYLLDDDSKHRAMACPAYVVKLRVARFDLWNPNQRQRFFVTDQILGSGGFAEVRLGIQLPQGRPVACKIFKPASSTGLTEEMQHEYIRMCQHEFEVMKTFSNYRNVAQVIDFKVVQGGEPILFMELLAVTLQNILDQFGAFEPLMAITYIKQAASGLQALALSGFVHADVKINNMMLTSDTGQLKITDFGLSFKAGTSMTGATPFYVAPELLRPNFSYDEIQEYEAAAGMISNSSFGSNHGESGYWAASSSANTFNSSSMGAASVSNGAVNGSVSGSSSANSAVATHAADCYSLGVCLWKMLTGLSTPMEFQRPKALSYEFVKARHQFMMDNFPDADLQEYPGIREILEKCLDFNPDNRPRFTDVMLFDPMMTSEKQQQKLSDDKRQRMHNRHHHQNHQNSNSNNSNKTKNSSFLNSGKPLSSATNSFAKPSGDDVSVHVNTLRYKTMSSIEKASPSAQAQAPSSFCVTGTNDNDENNNHLSANNIKQVSSFNVPRTTTNNPATTSEDSSITSEGSNNMTMRPFSGVAVTATYNSFNVSSPSNNKCATDDHHNRQQQQVQNNNKQSTPEQSGSDFGTFHQSNNEFQKSRVAVPTSKNNNEKNPDISVSLSSGTFGGAGSGNYSRGGFGIGDPRNDPYFNTNNSGDNNDDNNSGMGDVVFSRALTLSHQQAMANSSFGATTSGVFTNNNSVVSGNFHHRLGNNSSTPGSSTANTTTARNNDLSANSSVGGTKGGGGVAPEQQQQGDDQQATHGNTVTFGGVDLTY